VSALRDGKGFRAPSFLRAKPQPPAAAAELVEGRSLDPAVVCEVGWVNGLAAIRSLGRTGVPVIAVDHREFALGFRSGYAFPVLVPDPVEDEDGFVTAMRELGEALGRPAPLFPTHDEYLNALSRHLHELSDRYRCPFPAWDVLEPLQSKRRQLETAAQIGIGVPRTLHPASAGECRAAADEIGFPLLVKPSDNVLFKRLYRRQAFLCRDMDELERAYERASAYGPMVQEFVPGDADCLWTLGVYVAEDEEVLATFCGRKVKQTGDHVGTARVGEAVWDEEVVDSGLRLLRELDFHGIAQVEWKRDPRDGELKLMEVNPRLWQWHGLSAACGADVTLAAYWDLLGRRRGATRTYGCRRRWSISLLPGQAPLFERPPYTDAVFALDDPKPGLVNVARYALRAFSH
jgi:predicted ATP-grasp superfamily ATP-dependent carboligase